MRGGCLCGKHRYQIAGSALSQGICYCRDCQRAGGADGNPLLVVLSKDFRCEREGLSHYASPSDRGSVVKRYFCPDCGSHLFAEIEDVPGIVTVKAASLDAPGAFEARFLSWTQSAQPWTVLPEKVPNFRQNVPITFFGSGIET